jgi:hypothetical protein
LNVFFLIFFFLNLVVQNIHHVLQSELLSRRLAYFCCKRLSAMFIEYSNCLFETTVNNLKTLCQTTPTLTQSNNDLTTKTEDTTSNSSTTPPTKLKPFVTNTALTSSVNTSVSTGSSVKLSSSSSNNSVNCQSGNEITNYTLRRSISIRTVIF